MASEDAIFIDSDYSGKTIPFVEVKREDTNKAYVRQRDRNLYINDWMKNWPAHACGSPIDGSDVKDIKVEKVDVMVLDDSSTDSSPPSPIPSTSRETPQHPVVKKKKLKKKKKRVSDQPTNILTASVSTATDPLISFNSSVQTELLKTESKGIQVDLKEMQTLKKCSIMNVKSSEKMDLPISLLTNFNIKQFKKYAALYQSLLDQDVFLESKLFKGDSGDEYFDAIYSHRTKEKNLVKDKVMLLLSNERSNLIKMKFNEINFFKKELKHSTMHWVKSGGCAVNVNPALSCFNWIEHFLDDVLSGVDDEKNLPQNENGFKCEAELKSPPCGDLAPDGAPNQSPISIGNAQQPTVVIPMDTSPLHANSSEFLAEEATECVGSEGTATEGQITEERATQPAGRLERHISGIQVRKDLLQSSPTTPMNSPERLNAVQNQSSASDAVLSEQYSNKPSEHLQCASANHPVHTQANTQPVIHQIMNSIQANPQQFPFPACSPMRQNTISPSHPRMQFQAVPNPPSFVAPLQMMPQMLPQPFMQSNQLNFTQPNQQQQVMCSFNGNFNHGPVFNPQSGVCFNPPQGFIVTPPISPDNQLHFGNPQMMPVPPHPVGPMSFHQQVHPMVPNHQAPMQPGFFNNMQNHVQQAQSPKKRGRKRKDNKSSNSPATPKRRMSQSMSNSPQQIPPVNLQPPLPNTGLQNTMVSLNPMLSNMLSTQQSPQFFTTQQNQPSQGPSVEPSSAASSIQLSVPHQQTSPVAVANLQLQPVNSLVVSTVGQQSPEASQFNPAASTSSDRPIRAAQKETSFMYADSASSSTNISSSTSPTQTPKKSPSSTMQPPPVPASRVSTGGRQSVDSHTPKKTQTSNTGINQYTDHPKGKDAVAAKATKVPEKTTVIRRASVDTPNISKKSPQVSREQIEKFKSTMKCTVCFKQDLNVATEMVCGNCCSAAYCSRKHAIDDTEHTCGGENFIIYSQFLS